MNTNNSPTIIDTDNDPHLNYEKNNILTKFFNFFAATFLNFSPPKIVNFLIDKTTPMGKEVRDKATTYYALDAMSSPADGV